MNSDPNKEKNKLQVIKNRLFKAVFFIFAFVFILFFSIIGLLQIPAVQTYVVQKISESVSERINYPISIGGVNISWFDTIVLEEVLVNDSIQESFIGSEKIAINFELKSLISSKIITIEHVELYNPVVSLNWDIETNKLNINDFIKSIRESFKKSPTEQPKFIPFQILSAGIHNGYFSYSDYRKNRMTVNMFDHNYFSVDSIYAQCSDFYLHRDTIQIQVTGLKGIEQKTNFNIKNIDAFFRYTKSSLEFEHVSAYAEDSYISNNIVFRYDNPLSLNYFIDSVNINLSLDSTVIHTKDLATFAPQVKVLNDTWTISGEYSGGVTDFSSKNARVWFGQSSVLKGEISFDGLPNVFETFIKVDLTNSTVTAKDLAPYLRKEKYIREARKFGTINFDADFAGFPKDFAAHGNFDTKLGSFYSDIRFEIKKNEVLSYYKGQLKTKNFELGKFIEDKRVGKIAMEGDIEGTGFSIENAKVDLNATIQHLYINKYDYKNIFTNAHLENEFFSGHVNILDSNLIFITDGTLDLREGANIVDIKSNLKGANLKNLHLSDDTLNISSILDLNLKGLDLDKVQGTADLKNTSIYQNKTQLNFDDFFFKSVLEEDQRTFSINSSILEFDAKGDFKFEEIYKDFDNLLYEYVLLFKNDSIATKKYYQKKKGTTSNYHLTFKTLLKDVDPLIHIINKDIDIARDTEIKGTISQGKTSVVNISSEIEYFRYQNLGFHNNVLELNSAKSTDSTEALMMCYFTCQKQDLNNEPNARDLLFEGIWYKDTIDFTAKIFQYSKSNYADLRGNITFHKDKIKASLQDSKLRLIEKTWSIDDKNLITATKDKITFNNVTLANNEQKVTVNGAVGKNETTSLNIEQFDLLNLEPIINIKLFGTFNGKAQLTGLWDKKPSVTAQMSVTDFKVKNESVGDIQGKIAWKHNLQRLDVDVFVERNSYQIAQLTGDFTPDRKASPLKLKAKFHNTDIGFLEPLLYGHVTNLQGLANGEMNITGTIKHPKFYGSPMVTQGELTIDYFKTRYKFNEAIYFKGDSIYLKNAILTDTLWKTKGTINGGITHEFFKNFKADLSINLKNTFVLNTTEKDNNLYYGSAFGSGLIKAYGPFNDLMVTSNEVKSEKGTKIYIPLEGTESITQKDYIRFINKKEKLKRSSDEENENKKTSNTSGITAEINFDITDDAHFEVIFDKKAGDIVRTNGLGTILLKMDTRGDFNVYGSYEIQKGTYNFTLVNLINKAFKIQPNSTITWNGDPYEGQLNIRAAYRQNASILPLLKGSVDSTFTQKFPDVKRRVPVTVFLILKGKLLTPQISFDISITEYPNYPEVENAIKDLQSRIKYNEQLLNNQVFSLMVLKQLSPLDQLQVDLGSSSANSVSELFSNQFSYWLGQFDENLEVDIDLSGFNQEDNNTFRLRLSYSILDGKIRVTRDGNFTNLENQSQLANVFGEWTIEYLLTDNGKLKMKAYNRTNQNTVSTALSNSTSTLYGLSLTYTESFDNLGEIFRKNPNKIEATKEEEFELETPDEEPPLEKDSTDINQDTIINDNKINED